MAKPRNVFICRTCGATQTRWMGKCPDCGTWESLEPHTIDPAAQKDPHRPALAWTQEDVQHGGPANPARPLTEVEAAGVVHGRLATGIDEFDRVMGGAGPGARGVVPGSAILVGGEPGIGKSTLLLQAAHAWTRHKTRVLYVSSEESAEQIKLRSARLIKPHPGSSKTQDDELFVLSDTNLSRIVEQARRIQPGVLIIDSIQMIYKSDLPAGPGSVTQLRRCCTDLVSLAKLSGMAVILVGHVTKDGTLAGPRLLEHLVDAVLSFEGDRYHAHRVVRAVKNRFGTTLEIGLFEMTSEGLRQSPEGAGVAAITLSEKPRPGSVVSPVMTGTRCVLVEIQALTATGFLGAAKRKCSGIDANRLAMLIAVLEQHAGLRLADRDVFASSVGGLRIVEPGADLALLLAIAGSHFKRALAPATCALGEIGLGGEVRPVPHLDQRLAEASRLGYKRIIIPASDLKNAPQRTGVEIVGAATIDRAIEELG
ncbi:MAG TPA: DNA repair protein RadA [Phycisphaerales bacterium]|nr:DNA repair protein RadA [Phycisphaerales bacterium]